MREYKVEALSELIVALGTRLGLSAVEDLSPRELYDYQHVLTEIFAAAAKKR